MRADYFKGQDGPNIVGGRKAVMSTMLALPDYTQQNLERVELSARSLLAPLPERERRKIMVDMKTRPAIRSNQFPIAWKQDETCRQLTTLLAIRNRMSHRGTVLRRDLVTVRELIIQPGGILVRLSSLKREH